MPPQSPTNANQLHHLLRSQLLGHLEPESTSLEDLCSSRLPIDVKSQEVTAGIKVTTHSHNPPLAAGQVQTRILKRLGSVIEVISGIYPYDKALVTTTTFLYVYKLALISMLYD
jgi:hypothetical protein